MLEFTDCVRCHSLCVFFLHLDLLDRNEFRWIGFDMPEVDVCVCSFSEFLACSMSVRKQEGGVMG
jgi:hypothetical protein